MSCLHGPLPHLWNKLQMWFHTIRCFQPFIQSPADISTSLCFSQVAHGAVPHGLIGQCRDKGLASSVLYWHQEMLKRKEKGDFNPVIFLDQPACTCYCQVARDVIVRLTELAGSEVTLAQRILWYLCVWIWNNSWSAQREVMKKPDPVNADLGNNNQGISWNKNQPKKVLISFSDWSSFSFFLITHRFCKTSAAPFPDISSTTWKFWWILWKYIKYETSSGFFSFHPIFCTM